jgi:hypothetical protein
MLGASSIYVAKKHWWKTIQKKFLTTAFLKS